VQKVVLNHNHTFVSPDKTHMIRSQCRLLQADKHTMKNMREGEIGPTGIYNFAKTRVSFRILSRIKGLMQQRKKYS
jgi:hypothetical protein